MGIFSLLSRHAPNKLFISMIAGALSGACYALLIPLVMQALKPDGREEGMGPVALAKVMGIEVANSYYALAFFATCVAIVVFRTLSQVVLVRVSLDVTSALRKRIYKRVSSASIQGLEKIGIARLIQLLTTDVQRLVNGASNFPALLVNLVTLFGLLVFLALINFDVFRSILYILLLGVVTYMIPVIISNRYFSRSRSHMDRLQEGFNALVRGAKELKLNKEKSDHFMEEALEKEERIAIGLEKTGYTITQGANSYGDLISFLTIGFVSFVFVNYHSVSSSDLVGVVMALLYISGPIAAILAFAPTVVVARVSLKRINALFEELPVEDVASQYERVPEWQVLHLQDLRFAYESDDGFSVGPISFSIKRGEITFIVGGNGSGKSTLSKLISLHYAPTGGCIRYGDVVLGPNNLNSYRQEVACIYSDYYLFSRLHAAVTSNDEIKTRVRRYLVLLELDGKVGFENGQFSTLDLSDGQRRRLALLVAFIDNKNLYVFDEWAADQDPHFKEVFYHEILPALKSQGKAVVVISHDDRFFDVADKVIAMEAGRQIELPHGVTLRERLQDASKLRHAPAVTADPFR